jgi:hydrogenase nickel incorporation protein HypA/HybF
MHELSLVAELFTILEEKLRAEKAKKITSVSLRIGRLSGIVPELLASAFDSYKKGTFASKADLRVEIVPLLVRCRSCGKETPTGEPLFVCPACGLKDLEIAEGQDLILEKLEIEL